MWKNLETEYPKDGERVLVWYNNQIEILTFNKYHECWDDSDGDDYFTDLENITLWISLPPSPKE